MHNAECGTHSSKASRMFSFGSGPSRATAFVIASAMVPVSMSRSTPPLLPRERLPMFSTRDQSARVLDVPGEPAQRAAYYIVDGSRSANRELPAPPKSGMGMCIRLIELPPHL